ncbi:hypothetical protein NUSPORA_00600 [Nucleospora cyclopteri]
MLLEMNTTVVKVEKTPYDLVPKAHLEGSENKLSIDFHAGLITFCEGDAVDVKIFFYEMPETNDNSYIMSGVLYETAIEGIKVSFGGLILELTGKIPDDLEMGCKVFIILSKI